MAATSMILRADASATVGLGHAVRCLALALALRNLGHAPAVVSRRSGAEAREMVRAAGIPFVTIDAETEREDATETLNVVAQRCARTVIVDHYGLGVEWWRSIRRSCFLAAIDDEGRKSLGPEVNFVLNQNPAAQQKWYAGADQVLTGVRYALLRPEFRALRDAVPRARPLKRILVTLGGADTQALTGIVVEGLATLPPGIGIDVIVGPAATLDASTTKRLRRESRFRVHHAPEDLPELMARTDLAVTAGGSTVYELACLGVPALVVEVAGNQAGICDAMSRAGAVGTLRSYTELTPVDVREAVARLLDDPELRARMAAAGRSLVDGMGAQRVAMALSKGQQGGAT